MKVANTFLLGLTCLAALAVAAPALVQLADALVPLVLVVGMVVAVLQVVRYLTQR